MNEAKVAASHIFKILDSEDEEQQQKREGSKMIKDSICWSFWMWQIDYLTASSEVL
jgi:hypothetical protein